MKFWLAVLLFSSVLVALAQCHPHKKRDELDRRHHQGLDLSSILISLSITLRCLINGGGSLINSRWVCLKFLIFFPTDESRFHLGEKKEDEKSERFDELNVPFGFGMTSFDQAFDEVEGKTIFNKNSSFESNSGGGTQCCFNAQITLYGRGIG